MFYFHVFVWLRICRSINKSIVRSIDRSIDVTTDRSSTGRPTEAHPFDWAMAAEKKKDKIVKADKSKRKTVEEDANTSKKVKKQVEGIRQKWNAAQSQRTVTLKTSIARGDQLHTRTPLWDNFERA